MSLQKRVAQLALEHPEYREKLVPLLRTASIEQIATYPLRDFRYFHLDWIHTHRDAKKSVAELTAAIERLELVTAEFTKQATSGLWVQTQKRIAFASSDVMMYDTKAGNGLRLATSVNMASWPGDVAFGGDWWDKFTNRLHIVED